MSYLYAIQVVMLTIAALGVVALALMPIWWAIQDRRKRLGR